MFNLSGGNWLNSSGTPVANGSLTLTLSASATVKASGAAAPASYVFNLDGSGNLPTTAAVYGNAELLPLGTYYIAAVFSGANATGTELWGPTNWVVGPCATYTGSLYPNVTVLPQITVTGGSGTGGGGATSFSQLSGSLSMAQIPAGGSNSVFLRGDGVWGNPLASSMIWGGITGTLSSQTDLQSALNLKATLASPALTGTPTAPTAAVNTNSTQIATTAYVVNQGYLTNSTLTSTYAPLANPNFTGTVKVAGSQINFTNLAGTLTMAQIPTGGSSTTFLRGDGTWQGVSAGSATWGAINGTLSNQTDLNTALTGKASLTGATFTGTVTGTTINATTGFQINGVALSLASLTGSVSVSQLPPLGASGSSHTAGIAPDPGATAGTTRYLREDASWDVPPNTGAWGQITGTLSAQTDLQSALNAKASTTSPTFSGTVTATTINVTNEYQVNGSMISYSNINGNVPAAALPQPEPTSLGGVNSFTPVANQFLTGITTGSGTVTAAQPSFSNISGSIATTQLPVFIGSGSTHAIGAVPDAGATAGTSRFLREDATWQVTGAVWGAITGTLSSQTDLNTALGLKAPIASPTFTGTVTIPTCNVTSLNASTGITTAALTITGTSTVLNVNSVNCNSLTIDSSPLSFLDLSGYIQVSQLLAFGASGSSHNMGSVPDPGATAGTSRFLREDSTWDVPNVPSLSGGDLGGTYSAPTVVSTHLTTPLPIAQGGTGVGATSVENGYVFAATNSGYGGVSSPEFRALVATDLPARTATINYIIDGGGVTPTAATYGQIYIPVACTITAWNLSADVIGSAAVAISYATYSNFPTMSSICTATLSSTQVGEGTTSFSVAAGSYIQFSITSATTVTRLNIALVASVIYG